MPETTTRMICPYCQTEMNQHAEKLIEPRTVEEASAVDEQLGALVEEFHSCPTCGRGASRHGG
jgi:uncharacterized protein with PIN domain